MNPDIRAENDWGIWRIAHEAFEGGFDSVKCGEERAIAEINLAYLSSTLGRRSRDPNTLKDMLTKAADMYKEALSFFEADEKYARYRIVTANNLVSVLTILGGYLDSDERLGEADKIYQEHLNPLAANMTVDEKTTTEINEAGWLNERGRVNASLRANYLQRAEALCRNIITLRNQNPDRYWAVACNNLGTALYLQGKDKGEGGERKLLEAIKACDDAKRVFQPDADNWLLRRSWALASKTQWLANEQLALLDRSGKKGEYQRAAAQSFRDASVLCDWEYLVHSKMCGN